MRHLFDIDDLSPETFDRILTLAVSPVTPVTPAAGLPLAGQGVALLFEKPSARTRNSTEMAVVDLGGHPVYIQGTEVGLDERETAEDVARTLGCYHRVLCARVFEHAVLVGYGVVIGAATFASFAAAGRIAKLLGRTGINVMTRLMGLILAAMAVELLSDGLTKLFPALAGGVPH